MSPDITSPTNDLRQRSFRKVRSPRHSHPSSPAHRASPKKPKQSPLKPNKQLQLLEKCYSEPLLFPPIIGDHDDHDQDDHHDASLVGGCRSFNYSGEEGCLTRFHTYHDHLPSLIDSPLSRINAGYDKDAKVVINVAVEGSPGPIRTLVKLGTSVEDTINLVVRKYGDEGRTPRLDKDSFSFDLHVSYFSLQCLDRSDAIGDAGSRSFYLRKSDKKNHIEGDSSELATSDQTQDGDAHGSIMSPSKQVLRPQMAGFPPFFARRMNKLERRFLRVFKVLGCLDSNK